MVNIMALPNFDLLVTVSFIKIRGKHNTFCISTIFASYFVGYIYIFSNKMYVNAYTKMGDG